MKLSGTQTIYNTEIEIDDKEIIDAAIRIILKKDYHLKDTKCGYNPYIRDGEIWITDEWGDQKPLKEHDSNIKITPKMIKAVKLTDQLEKYK